MQNILLSVLATTLAAGIITSLAEGSGFEKYLRYFSALLLTLAILTPLQSILTHIGDLPLASESEDIETEVIPHAYLRQFEAEVEKAVAILLEKEFALTETDCRTAATARQEGNAPCLIRLQVTLYTVKAAAKTGKIRDKLTESCGCDIIISESI